MKIKTTLKAFPRDEMIQRIFNNEIFIYPTDTIYGIGCNALDELAVQKIRLIKGRDDKPFSVIAPSFDWIYENCDVDVDLKKYLPWPYTIILKKKNPKYHKFQKTVHKFKARDDSGLLQTGDVVTIEETRPISKGIHHMVIK